MADTCLNVKDFGAIGDGRSHPLSERYTSLADARVDYPHATSLRNELDWAAIQAAVNAAASSGCTQICIAPGRYLISSTILIAVDNLSIVGSPGAVIVEDVARPQDAFIPLLAQKHFPQKPPDPTYNLSIQGITVEYVQAGPDSAGGIQLNACVDFCVDNVRIIGNGTGMNGSLSNGIACSYPQSTGVFRNVTVIGMSKPGLYAAGGHDIRFEGCVAKNCVATTILSGKTPLKVPGFGIGNAKNVSLIGCHAYENSGPGVQITNLGTCPPNPYANLQVIGGHFHHNGTYGMRVGSHLADVQGSNLQIIDVDCSDNTLAGIALSSARNVLIANCMIARNESGLVIQDVAPELGQDQTNLVTVRGCQIYDNTKYGMILRATNNVTIENCRVYHTAEQKQLIGLGIWYNGTPPTQKKNTYLRIVDVDFYPMLPNEKPIEQESKIDSAVEIGYYRLQSLTIGPPNGKLYAPPGSEYTDLQTGIRYLKARGFDDQNWRSIVEVMS